MTPRCAGYGHVAIAVGFDLIATVRFANSIKFSEHIIEESEYFAGRHFGRDGCETDDIGEEDGDLREIIGDFLAFDEAVCNTWR